MLNKTLPVAYENPFFMQSLWKEEGVYVKGIGEVRWSVKQYQYPLKNLPNLHYFRHAKYNKETGNITQEAQMTAYQDGRSHANLLSEEQPVHIFHGQSQRARQTAVFFSKGLAFENEKLEIGRAHV